MLEPRSESDRDASERELVFSRVIDAPRELVFAAWTSREHLPHWYGPRGFTTTIHSMDVRVGGETKLTMHGPDGANYPNTLAYKEVEAPSRLVYVNRGSREGAEPAQHTNIITFDASGAKTKITMRLVFASATAREIIVKEYRADEGGKQTLERLGAHVDDMTFVIDPVRPRVVMARLFDAPSHLVFSTLVTPAHLARWWGPRNLKLVTCELELRPGGAYRFVLRGPDGGDAPFAGAFREIAPPSRLVMTQRYDVEPYKQYESVVTAELAAFGAKTMLTVVEEFASMAERDGKLGAGMRGGAVESHNRLAELLDDLIVRGTELDLTRTFAASRTLVWDAFTKPEHAKRWLAPPPLVMAKLDIDLRPGGAITMIMRAPDGREFPSTGTVREVVPRERFAWRGTIHGGIEVETVITFTGDGERTTVAVHQAYSHVGPPTMGAKMGWLASLDALDGVLASLR